MKNTSPVDSIFKCLFFLIAALLSSFSSVHAQAKHEPQSSYFQEIKSDIHLPGEAGKNVAKLFSLNNCRIVVTSKGIYRYENGKWIGKTMGTDWRNAIMDSNNEVWLVSAQFLQKETETKKINLPNFAQKDTILSLHWESKDNLLVGTTNGLLIYNGTWETVLITKGKRINSIVKTPKGDLWLATNDGLLNRVAGKWTNLDDNLMAVSLKRTYFCLESVIDNPKILFGGLLVAGCIAENGNNWILSGADGLPYGPVTVIKMNENDVWMGTDQGLIKRDDSWHFYNGKRWLPDNKIIDILPINRHTVWVGTPKGICQIQEVEMTLEQKAAVFEDRVQSRHIRHGLVSRSILTKSGDLATNLVTNTHNEGLWTSIYMAAECFRYAVTNDPVAKANAEKAFIAMERLETITGISGYPARTVALYNEQVDNGEWHLSSDKKWKWMGDTSSDEMIGHLFVYPIFYDLVADHKIKPRVENLVKRILNHIIENNYQLVDLDGKPTRWGIWCPDSLNHSSGWAYERGTNSLQILSFLKAGTYITKESKFDDAANFLIKNHGYAENMIQLKKYGPYDVNYVDNQLAFLPYYILARYNNDAQLQGCLEKSLNRTWNVVKKDQISMWNIITSACLKKDCDLPIALEELKSIPMDMVNWTIENSHRWDLPQNPLNDRFDKKQSTRPIPAAERGITKWNLNPYRFDYDVNGMEENDGAYFLLAYWMGRYHGFFY